MLPGPLVRALPIRVIYHVRRGRKRNAVGDAAVRMSALARGALRSAAALPLPCPA